MVPLRVAWQLAFCSLHQWLAKYVVSRNRDLPGEGGRRRQVYRIDHGGESKSHVAISLENGRVDEGEDGKIQIHHSGRHHSVCFPLFAGGSAWSPWRTAGSWRFVKRHAAKRKLNTGQFKDEPPFCVSVLQT